MIFQCFHTPVTEMPMLKLYCATHQAMGTEYSLYLYAESEPNAKILANLVFQEIDRVEDLISHYREGSELSRINREAAQAEVTTDPETFRFLKSCLAWSERSHGAFDITVGSLLKCWGFFEGEGMLPSASKIAREHNRIGWRQIRLDPERRTVRFLAKGIALDPGGIGKGYAVDCAIQILKSHGVSAAMLSSGSSTIYALGTPPGEPGWKVRVPLPGARTLSTVVLHDTSLSTANLSEKNFITDGHLYGSIMDPRTLRPVEHTLQVTAISPCAIDSDALSNALFVLDTADRVSLLKQMPHVSALVLNRGQNPSYEEVRWPAQVTGLHVAQKKTFEEMNRYEP